MDSMNNGKNGNQNPSPALILEQWESALETVLRSSLEPLRAEICVNTQRVLHLEDHVQALSEELAMWPQHWNQSLGCLVAQLQRIVSNETSADAQASLQEQLRRLIAALSSWNGQLKTELALQQQLIDSLERLEGRLDESSKG
jgi:DNA repair exonuclease SbcCD ATPase subunit